MIISKREICLFKVSAYVGDIESPIGKVIHWINRFFDCKIK